MMNNTTVSSKGCRYCRIQVTEFDDGDIAMLKPKKLVDTCDTRGNTFTVQLGYSRNLQEWYIYAHHNNDYPVSVKISYCPKCGRRLPEGWLDVNGFESSGVHAPI